ncbi:hypothetical protein [Archangium lipolyticum]|uniref:hypothetical protein n=1 Tax=Archangium lipolyticum TaxID=2970465 RepID=UPI002149D59B|nr:hypothetical protein [Archangium lipolyticum]
MTNIFGKATLALVAVGTVAVLPISSLASAEQKPSGDIEGLVATTATICSSALTPSGWVDIQWWNSSSCGSTLDPNTKKIQQLTTLPVGSTVNACHTTYPPPGWSQVSYYFSSACRSSPVSSLNPNTWTLKRVY